MNIQRIPTAGIAMMVFAVALAGCIGDSNTNQGPSDTQSTENPEVTLGSKGAIRGLVVDDNFRPVQLKENWEADPGDFQDVGFVLILETGQRFETNENGEFTVIPLDPGKYTLRVAADVHEAKDTTVEVVSGEYAEVTVEARRQYSGGGTILSQEYVIFIQCTANAGYIGATNVFCGDLSGDGQRAAFYPDYSGVAEDVRGMVTEMRAVDDGYYGVDIRTHELSCGSYNSFNGCLFIRKAVDNGKYIHMVLYPFKKWTPGDEYIEEGQDGYCTIEDYDAGASGCGPWFAMTFDRPFQTILFPDIDNRYFIDLAYETSPVSPPLNKPWGFGPKLGVKAQFLQSVFLYELPDEGIQDYCALCDDYQIPE